MNKKFTDNELRAYSKNRFEERSLRRRLDKLRDEVVTYHDASAKRRIDLIEEGKGIRKTSGGSPVPHALLDPGGDYVFTQRLRRPWAYSVMETTYNNVYREGEIPLPKKRGRPRAKSAATTLLGKASSVNIPIDKYKSHRADRSVLLPRVTQSARYVGKLPLVIEPVNGHSEKDVVKEQGKSVDHTSQFDGGSSECVDSESSQDLSQLRVDIMRIPSPNEEVVEEDAVLERDKTWFKDDTVDTRPYARVLKLPPAYTIDSKSYQEAERERLVSRSRSRVGFSSAGLASAANIKEPTPFKTKQDKPQDKSQEPNPEITMTKDNPTHEQESTLKKDDEQGIRVVTEEKGRNVLKAKENITFKGQIIRNYIRPEDRYKLDPAVLNRHQTRMDKLAKESSTYLKRINHENIKVEIAFPRSARKRLLTKLVQDNNSGKKKTISNSDDPIIQTKVERFMVSMSDYIERQRLDRANTFVY